MKKGIFLDFYYKTINENNNWMQWYGLCGNFDGLCCEDGAQIIGLFTPTKHDFEQLKAEGCNIAFWGSGLSGDSTNTEVASLFTPLRQTICLFAAAINDEL